MTPENFIHKWEKGSLTERAAAQSHFIDLCKLLGERPPTEADPDGEHYAFERGALKTTGRRGWADVWKRDHFAWEYKRAGKNLSEAYAQLQQYAPALNNPPLLIVSDTQEIRIHTNWTNTVSVIHKIQLNDLRDPKKRHLVKLALCDPEQLRPDQTSEALTGRAAAEFSKLAEALGSRGHKPHLVAHFLNRLVFCMFAQGVGLLRQGLFTELLEVAAERQSEFCDLTSELFRAMRSGGRIGFKHVNWFNGGLFDDDTVLELTRSEIKAVLAAARYSWADIDPSIFGTLFERSFDPDKRSQLGKFYTDRAKIDMVVGPVIVGALHVEWEAIKHVIRQRVADAAQAPSQAKRRRALRDAELHYKAFLDRLRKFRVLDPACGSGNFLYVALLALKDLEHQIGLEAETISAHLQREIPQVGPENLFGIEINAYAADLARITVWIGEIQWMLKRGWGFSREPVLRTLNNIQCRDALLTDQDTEASWPEADVVIGNPPFLGGKLLRSRLGDRYVESLFRIYEGRVPAEADLVAYWLALTWQKVKDGRLISAGLVTTNSVRAGANRRLLEEIVRGGEIFDAKADQPWISEGAAVRVSVICFRGPSTGNAVRLDGELVTRINADLTGAATDFTSARRLAENSGIAFMGDTKGGAFDVAGELARQWLSEPVNPNGRSNADVLRPWFNGMDITRRPSGKWIIDFGWEMDEIAAAQYEAPFHYLVKHVKPDRSKNRREIYAKSWWRHVEPRQGMWAALSNLKRYIATPRVSKHRLFVWIDGRAVPDARLFVFSRDDDLTFGILHSRLHELWTLRTCSWHGAGNDPTYNGEGVFGTFPFPGGLEPNRWSKYLQENPRGKLISDAARNLDALRNTWLNPPDLVKIIPEVVSGYPDRIIPANERAAEILKMRTLTNLYNTSPTWLIDAHRKLDAAVAAAYGWPADIPDDEALAELLALNLARPTVEAIAKRSVRPSKPFQQRDQLHFKLPLPGGVQMLEAAEEPEPFLGPESIQSRKRKARREL